jgi:hypothetical protein
MKRLILLLCLVSSATYAQRLDIDKINYLAAFRGLNMLYEMDSLLRANSYERSSSDRNIVLYQNAYSDAVAVSYDVNNNKYHVNVLTTDQDYHRILLTRIREIYTLQEKTDTYEVYNARNGFFQVGYENGRLFITRIVNPPKG